MKKILSIALASVLALGLTTSALAIVGPTNKEYSLGEAVVGSATSTKTLQSTEVIRPGDSIFMHVDLEDNALAKETTLTELKNDKITVVLRVTKGSKFLEKPEFKIVNGKAYVRMDAKDEYVSTKEEDVKFTVALAYNGVADTTDADIEVYEGKFGNAEYDQEIDSADAIYDANSAHLFVVAKNFSGKVNFDFGDDIMFKNVRVFSEQKFYLKLNRAANADISNEYGNDSTLDFYTFVGDLDKFSSVGTLSIPYDKNAYVYERTANGLVLVPTTYNTGEGAYEFTTNQLGNYVISDKKLDIKDVVEPVTPTAPAEPDAPVTPTAPVAPGNNNNNPSTGR